MNDDELSLNALNWAWSQKGLSHSAKLTLLCLCDHEKDHTCFPSLTRICTRTDLSRQGVVDALEELEQKHLIEKTKTKGIISTTYVVNWVDQQVVKSVDQSSISSQPTLPVVVKSVDRQESSQLTGGVVNPVDPNRNTLSNHNSNRIIKPAKKNSVIVLNPDEEEFVQKLYDYLKKNHAGITITLEGQREAFAKLKSKGFHLEDIRRAMKHATSDTIDKRRENGERGTYCHANNVKSLNKLLDKHGRQDQLWIGVLLDEVKQKQMRISEYE